MYRVTRKQLICQNGNVIEFEDSMIVKTVENAVTLQCSIRDYELALGGQPYGPSKVIFESPTFYRSVTVTIEEVS
jgi:hypothetical protein